MAVKRIRTIRESYSELKTADPQTAISLNFFRQSVPFIPGAFKVGGKWLLDQEEVEMYFSDPERLAKDRARQYEEARKTAGIRPIGSCR